MNERPEEIVVDEKAMEEARGIPTEGKSGEIELPKFTAPINEREA